MPDRLTKALDEATARLICRALRGDERIGIAVSGGADSMALLALATRAWPGQVAAATVNHGLRPDAADEARMVAAWSAEAGVQHDTLQVALPAHGNRMAQARDARYAALDAWADRNGLHWLMTAHQADDLFETILMRLGRGAGVTGLAAIRPRRGRWLRPLLGVRRAELRAFCVMQAVPFVDDPTNEDERFDRARLRAALGGNLPCDPAGLARSTAAAADADEALDWMTSEIARSHLLLGEGQAMLDRTDLPPELLRRLVGRMIAHLNPEADLVRGPRMDQALVQLCCAKAITLADCIVTGGPIWMARRAPPRKAAWHTDCTTGTTDAIVNGARHPILNRESERQ